MTLVLGPLNGACQYGTSYCDEEKLSCSWQNFVNEVNGNLSYRGFISKAILVYSKAMHDGSIQEQYFLLLRS